MVQGLCSVSLVLFFSYILGLKSNFYTSTIDIICDGFASTIQGLGSVIHASQGRIHGLRFGLYDIYFKGSLCGSRFGLCVLLLHLELVSESQICQSLLYKSIVQQILANGCGDVCTYIREALGCTKNLLLIVSFPATVLLVQWNLICLMLSQTWLIEVNLRVKSRV